MPLPFDIQPAPENRAEEDLVYMGIAFDYVAHRACFEATRLVWPKNANAASLKAIIRMLVVGSHVPVEDCRAALVAIGYALEPASRLFDLRVEALDQGLSLADARLWAEREYEARYGARRAS